MNIFDKIEQNALKNNYIIIQKNFIKITVIKGWATRVIHNCPQPPTLILLTVWFGSRLSSALASTVNTVHFKPFELDVDGCEGLWAALMSQSLTVSEGYRFYQVECYRFPKVTVLDFRKN